MKQINFDVNTVELIRKMTNINASILVQANADTNQIEIKGTDPSSSVGYIFKAPKSHLDFNGKEIGFLDFNEFYQLLKSIEDVTIGQDDGLYDLTLQGSRAKIQYRLTNSEVLPKPFNEIDFGDSDVDLVLTEGDLKQIVKMTSLVNAEFIKLTSNDKGEFQLCLFNKNSSNTFELNLEVDKSTNKNFELILPRESVLMLPIYEYKVSMSSQGIVKFEMETGTDATVEIYTAEVAD